MAHSIPARTPSISDGSVLTDDHYHPLPVGPSLAKEHASEQQADIITLSRHLAEQVQLTQEQEEKLQAQLRKVTFLTLGFGTFSLFAKGIVDAFFLQTLLEYAGYERAEEDVSVLIAGGIISTFANIPSLAAIVAYRREYVRTKITREILNEQTDHSHSHCDLLHIMQDILGIVAPSVAVGFAAGCLFTLQIAYPGKSITEINENEFWLLFPAGICVATFNAIGNMLMHGDFMEEGIEQHGHFFASFYDAMVNSITQRADSKKDKFLRAYLIWGSLFSHIAELGFSNTAGLSVFLTGLMHHVWDKEASETGIIISAWVLAVVGSTVHVHTEARAFEKYIDAYGYDLTKPLRKAWRADLSCNLKAMLIVQAAASLVVSILHALPDILGGPEVANADEWEDSARISFLIVNAILLGIPDTVTNITLLTAAFTDYFERNLKFEYMPPLLANTPGYAVSAGRISIDEETPNPDIENGLNTINAHKPTPG